MDEMVRAGGGVVTWITKVLVVVRPPSDTATLTVVLPIAPLGVKVSVRAALVPPTATVPSAGTDVLAVTVRLDAAVSRSFTVKVTVNGRSAGVFVLLKPLIVGASLTAATFTTI